MQESFLLSAAFFLYFTATIIYAFLFFKDAPRLKDMAAIMLGVGFLVQSAALIIRWRVAGHAPFTNLYESMIFFSWALVLSYGLIEYFLGVYRLGFLALTLNLTILIYAFSHDPTITPIMPALQSNWMLLHVTTCFLGYGAFAIAFLASLIFLTPLKKKRFSGEQLDQIIYRSILFGFPLLTLGVASGAIWANEAWGVYWSWDPKETWSLVTWMIYALYLHLRLMKNWMGKKIAWVAFVGFLSVIFTYLGVSYLLPGLHSYAGA